MKKVQKGELAAKVAEVVEVAAKVAAEEQAMARNKANSEEFRAPVVTIYVYKRIVANYQREIS